MNLDPNGRTTAALRCPEGNLPPRNACGTMTLPLVPRSTRAHQRAGKMQGCIVCEAVAVPDGAVAKWQGRGLQNPDRRFESGRRLQIAFTTTAG